MRTRFPTKFPDNIKPFPRGFLCWAEVPLAYTFGGNSVRIRVTDGRAATWVVYGTSFRDPAVSFLYDGFLRCPPGSTVSQIWFEGGVLHTSPVADEGRILTPEQEQWLSWISQWA